MFHIYEWLESDVLFRCEMSSICKRRKKRRRSEVAVAEDGLPEAGKKLQRVEASHAGMARKAHPSETASSLLAADEELALQLLRSRR